MRAVGAVLAGAVLGLAVSEAGATPIIKSTSGLASPALTLDFDPTVYTSNTIINTQYQSSYGVSFASSVGGLYYTPIAGTAATQSGGTVGNFIGPSNTASALNTFSMMFDTAQTAVAFSLVATNNRSWTITAKLLGSVVETMTVILDSSSNTATAPNNSNLDQWYGFTGLTGTFDQIEFLRTPLTSGTIGVLVIDNVQMSALPPPPPPPPSVPAPASLALLCLGLVGAGGLRRRKN